MRWVERVNGNGVRFSQWQQTVADEPTPEWGPGETYTACPCCGAEYEQQYMSADRQWHAGTRWYIYHDPVRHRDWPGIRKSSEDGKEPPEVHVPREPGE